MVLQPQLQNQNQNVLLESCMLSQKAPILKELRDNQDTRTTKQIVTGIPNIQYKSMNSNQ